LTGTAPPCQPSGVPLEIPISENYPHFLWRSLLHPVKVARAALPVRRKPSYVWIEVTDRCNLRCKSCDKLYIQGGSVTDMEMELFERVYHALPDVETMNLTGIGEFFVHRQVDRIFEMCLKRPYMRMLFTTNSKLLTEEWLERLTQKRCDVIFSIDGTTQETHQYNRGRASDLDHIKWSLERAQALEREWKGDEPFPFRRHINMVVMRQNMHQLAEIVEWGKRYGVEDVRLTLMANWGIPAELWRDQNPLFYREELIRHMGEARAKAAELGLPLIAPPVEPLPPGVAADAPTDAIRGEGLLRFFKPNMATQAGVPRFTDRFCDIPWTSIYFAATGRASVCCGASHIELGNIRTQEFDDIWNGWRFRQLRMAMASGSHTSYCRTCDLPYGLAAGNPRGNLAY